jgi:phage baseplate assembly protein W
MIMINTCMAQFKGMSTVDKVSAPYTLVDSELVKRDLLNEIYTKKGERVMRPTFGCIVWDLLMEQDTPQLEEMVREDLERICNRDPRIAVNNINIFKGDHSIRAEIDLRYIMLNSAEVLYLDFQEYNEAI